MRLNRSTRPILAFLLAVVGSAGKPAFSIEPAPNGPPEVPSTPPQSNAPTTGETTLADLFDTVRTIDPDARIQGHVARFRVRERDLILVGDEAAGRMRVMTPIVPVAEIRESSLRRMLQANFDAVLDARYAIANGIVWSAFIHPLPPLARSQFESAIEQVWAAAETFGTTYSSGALLYRGGDSEQEHRKLREAGEATVDPPI